MEVNGKMASAKQSTLVCWHHSQSLLPGHGVGVPQQGEGKVRTCHTRQTDLRH